MPDQILFFCTLDSTININPRILWTGDLTTPRRYGMNDDEGKERDTEKDRELFCLQNNQ